MELEFQNLGVNKVITIIKSKQTKEGYIENKERLGQDHLYSCKIKLKYKASKVKLWKAFPKMYAVPSMIVVTFGRSIRLALTPPPPTPFFLLSLSHK